MESLRAFELERPTTVSRVAALLAENADARVIAGGTDLMPNLRRRLEQPGMLIDVTGVAEIAEFALAESGLRVGAGVTVGRLASDPLIDGPYRALGEAARAIAGPAHRSAATVGGNLCLDTRCVYYNQSEWWRASNGFCLKRGGEICHVAPQGERCHAAFSGDLAPALLVLHAQVELVSTAATRSLALADLYRDDGAAHLTRNRDELLAHVLVPAPAPNVVSGYRKARVRGAIDFPLAGVACALAMRDGVLERLDVALTGTNSRPIVLDGTAAFVGRPVDADALAALGKLVQKQVSPMRTTLTQANYRRQVAAVLTQRLVSALAQFERGRPE